MNNEAAMVLEDTVSFCERDGLDARLIQMLKQCVPIDLTDDSLQIEAPSRFAYSYLMRHRETLERYLAEITFSSMSLQVTVAMARGSEDSRETAAPVRGVAAEPSRAGEPAAPDAPDPGAGAVAAGTARVAIPPIDLSGTGSRKVTITNTISPRELARLRGNMHQQTGERGAAEDVRRDTAAADGGIAAPSAAAERDNGATSKFTFENFVHGNENKHAYSSALRFAAMADEPGSCTSLFIYGKSGLGKTHLLLAIKNLLAQDKPYLRVKYVNSQTYIDDYITGLQEGRVAAAMRDYHNADILIIDDIQNIIGKTQSIENFFQLMDEFIRNNKKVAIASDRAPKNLGMDERLTSRFNAGMLCLVSEPSYEMKLTILKRYYETTILPASAPGRERSGGNALLDAIRQGTGRLTDEHLSHMAQVSGTNIRELESFCERCAGESFEAEQEGRELTGDEIDRIANEYFDSAHKKIHIDTVQKVVEEFYHVSHADLIGPRRTADIKNARHVAVYLALEMCEMTMSAVGASFGGRDHSTVVNSIRVVEKRLKADRTFIDDLQTLRNKIRLRS